MVSLTQHKVFIKSLVSTGFLATQDGPTANLMSEDVSCVTSFFCHKGIKANRLLLLQLNYLLLDRKEKKKSVLSEIKVQDRHTKREMFR